MQVDIDNINEFEYKGFILKLRWHPKYKRTAVGYKEQPKEAMWSIHLLNDHAAGSGVYSKSTKEFVYESMPSERKDLEDIRFTIEEAMKTIEEMK